MTLVHALAVLNFAQLRPWLCAKHAFLQVA